MSDEGLYGSRLMTRENGKPMPRYVPKYIPPGQAEKDRARRRAMLYGIAVSVPLVLMLLVFGYSDQAPAPLRSAVIAIDKSFGYPIARFLGVAVAP